MKRKIFEWEHDAFRESVRAFLKEEVQPHAERWREAGIVDREAFRKAGGNGFLLIWADEKYGGQGIEDFRYEQVIMEETPRYGEPGFYMTLHSRLAGPYIQHFGNEEQKERYLPKCVTGETILAIAITEPDAGSDVAGLKSTAVDKGDYYLLNGSKTYVSNGINADLVIVVARTVPDDHRGLGLFQVERGMEGFRSGRKLEKIGLHAQDTAELFFDNVEVPRENVLGEPDKGFYYLMQGLAEERLICAVQSLAAAEEAFRLTMEHIQERRAFGRPLAAFQGTRFRMADMRTEMDLAQVFIDRCVEEHNDGRLTGELAAEAKLYTSELEGRVTDGCVQLHGGAGYMAEYKIARLYANARVSRIYGGASEIMREIIARSLGLDPRKMS
ncbi:MAG: acyl-CoA dehydrogenase family protein [Thermoanaerobaculia bacterium]